MSISKHLKEHSILNVYGSGPNVFKVGKGGRFSTLSDAVEARNNITHTELTTFTGTMAAMSNVLVADTGTPLSSLKKGRTVGVRFGDATHPVVVGTVLSPTQIILNHPTRVTKTSLDVTVFSIVSATIQLLNGYDEIPTAQIILPSFTKFLGNGNGAAKITKSSELGTDIGLFPSDSSQNMIVFDGVDFDNIYDNSIYSHVWGIAANGQQELCDFGLYNCHGTTETPDLIFFDHGVAGGFYVDNCEFYGRYDWIRPWQSRHLRITNTKIKMQSLIKYTTFDASGIPLGELSSVDTTGYPQLYEINNNTIDCLATDLESLGVYATSTGIDVRNRLPTSARVIIANNNIKAQTDGGTDYANCIRAGAAGAGAETPTIIAVNNTLEAINSGTGPANTIHSENANYTIQRAGNVQVAGTIGSNTSAITTV